MREKTEDAEYIDGRSDGYAQGYAAGLQEGYEAGLREGARRERRWFLNYARNNFDVVGLEREFAEFEAKIASRRRKGK